MIHKHGDIRLRKIDYSDTPLIVKWRNSPSVRVNLFSQEILTPEKHNWWMENKVAKGECAQFIIELGRDNIPIGTVFIKNIDKINSKGEFGIFIGEDDARGYGYGTLATQFAIQYAFEQLNLNRISLFVFSDNYGAIKSYEKVGFRIEGNLRQDHKRADSYCDVLLMSIIKDDLREDI